MKRKPDEDWERKLQDNNIVSPNEVKQNKYKKSRPRIESEDENDIDS